MICGDCLYRKNCQLLGKHKKPLEVEGCTAFVNEPGFILRENIKEYEEFAKKLENHAFLAEVTTLEERVVPIKRIDELIKK